MALEASAKKRLLTPLEERFVKFGLEALRDCEVIELLLGLCLPPRESKKLAKECIKRCHNLRGVLTSSNDDLQKAGLTPENIVCIKFIQEMPEKFLKEKIINKPIYKSSREVFDYLYYSMRDLNKEVFKAIYLDNRGQIIDIKDLFEGTLESIPIRPREIVEAALKDNATAMIFVHNHTSGDPTPSKSDGQMTRDLVFVGFIVQIKVLDHIIIGDNKYFSFADEGLITKYEDSFLNLRIRGLVSRSS
jgi:DNA repair protein RadC